VNHAPESWNGRWKPGPIEVRVPLKLVVVGEYAVLEDEGVGVACAVDRYLRGWAFPARDAVSIRARRLPWAPAVVPPPSKAGSLTTGELDEETRSRYGFALRAAELAYAYVAAVGLPVRPLHLELDSADGQLERSGVVCKLGLGTSAATTVAVTALVLASHGVPIDRRAYRNATMRLGLLAHIDVQRGHGSGIDVVASVAGSVVQYRRAKHRWLRQLRDKRTSALLVARGAWPGMRIERLHLPKTARLLVGFTGRSVATPQRLAAYAAWRQNDREGHRRFVAMSRKAAALTRVGLESADPQTLGRGFRIARQGLSALADGTGLPIETPRLAALADLAHEGGAPGKLSGAGGGDCGIAIAFSRKAAERVVELWREAGIHPVRAEFERWGLFECRAQASDAESFDQEVL